jgi:hypothetical protein
MMFLLMTYKLAHSAQCNECTPRDLGDNFKNKVYRINSYTEEQLRENRWRVIFEVSHKVLLQVNINLFKWYRTVFLKLSAIKDHFIASWRTCRPPLKNSPHLKQHASQYEKHYTGG